MGEHIEVPNIVVIHSGGIDPVVAMKQAGIEGTSTVYGFTDTYPNENPLNASIGLISSKSDHLLVEDTLYDAMTPDSELAIKSQSNIMLRPYTLRIFTAGLGVKRIIAAQGYLRSELAILESVK